MNRTDKAGTLSRFSEDEVATLCDRRGTQRAAARSLVAGASAGKDEAIAFFGLTAESCLRIYQQHPSSRPAHKDT